MELSRIFAGSLLVLALGCSSKTDDPFTADMTMICNAGRGHDELPPDLRRMEALRDIAAKIKTPEAARLMASFIQVAPSERPALLAPALAKAGLTRCAFLDE